MIGSRRSTWAQSHFLFSPDMFTKVGGWNLSLQNGPHTSSVVVDGVDVNRRDQTFLIGCDWLWQSDNQVNKHSTLAAVLLKRLRPLTFLQSSQNNQPSLLVSYQHYLIHNVIQTDSARLVKTQKPQIRLPHTPPVLVTTISEI